MTGEGLSHLDERGRMRMVDVAGKDDTHRRAVARGRLKARPETVRLLIEGNIPKGDALACARLAGISGAKMTGQLIPLCHPLPLTGAEVEITPDAGKGEIMIEARVETVGKTGVEMEALTAVALAGLALYDMLKAVDRDMVLEDIKLITKEGGRSGSYRRGNE